MQVRKSGYLVFLLPAVLLVLFAEIGPAFYTIGLGFFKWDIITAPEFVGFRNYVRVFTSPDLLNALKNTVLWVVGTLVFPVGMSLVMAQFLYRMTGKSIFKSLFFIPATLSPSIAGVIWLRIFASRQGAVNSLVQLAGNEVVQFITNPDINTYLMIGVWTWQYLGINLLLFLVGLDTIPQDPQEAALIDGASPWQIFRHIRLPLLAPITLLVVSNSIINSLRMFDIPWLMIQGGPGRASETLAVSLYKESFLLFHMGQGSAIAVVISIAAFALTARYFTGGSGKGIS